MNRKAILMLIVCGVTVLLWASRFVPSIGLSADASDFFGGVTIGLAIGAAIVAAGESRVE
jgi:hypothetical protein